jgi:hypothetical protein
MEFLIGLSGLVLMIPFFVLVIYLMRMLPNEFTIGVVALMFIGDGAIALMVYYIGSDFIDNVRLLKLGMGCSFLIVTIFKVCYLVMNQTKLLDIIERNEIKNIKNNGE